MSEWIKAGEAAVDAGLIVITDPCYLVRRDGEPSPYTPVQRYDQLLDEMVAQDRAQDRRTGDGGTYQLTNQYGADFAVVIGGFGADGGFPVYVQRDKDGLVIGAQIRFDGKEPS